MGIFGPPNIEKLIDSLESISSQNIFEYLISKTRKEPSSIRKLIKLGIKAVPPLSSSVEKAIKSKNVNLLINAAYTLCKIKDKSAVPALLKAMEGDFYSLATTITKLHGKEASVTFDPFDRLYVEIVNTLYLMKDADIIAAIRKIVSNKKKVNVRLYGIRFLRNISNKEDIPLLMDCLADTNPDTGVSVRYEALKVLEEISRKGNHSEVIKALKEKDKLSLQNLIDTFAKDDTSLRKWAIKILGGLKDKRSLPAIALATQHEDPDLAKEARNALKAMVDEETAKAVLKIFKDYRNTGWWHRHHPARLKNIKNSTLKNLIFFLKCEEENIAKKALSNLHSLEIDITGILRHFLAKESRKLTRSKQVISIKYAYLKEVDFTADMVSLPMKYSGNSLRNSLTVKTRDPSHFDILAPRLYWLGGTESADALIDALNDYSINVRKTAIKYIGEIGDNRAVKTLVDIILKGYQEVEELQIMAVSSLEKIGDESAVITLEFIAGLLLSLSHAEVRFEVVESAKEALERLKKRKRNRKN